MSCLQQPKHPNLWCLGSVVSFLCLAGAVWAQPVPVGKEDVSADIKVAVEKVNPELVRILVV